MNCLLRSSMIFLSEEKTIVVSESYKKNNISAKNTAKFGTETIPYRGPQLWT